MSASISFLNSDRSALFRQRQQASVSYARMIQNLLRELELRCRYDIGECFDVGVDQFFEFRSERPIPTTPASVGQLCAHDSKLIAGTRASLPIRHRRMF